MFLNSEWVSCGQHVIGHICLSRLIVLCLLIVMFGLFTFNGTSNMVGIKSTTVLAVILCLLLPLLDYLNIFISLVLPTIYLLIYTYF